MRRDNFILTSALWCVRIIAIFFNQWDQAQMSNTSQISNRLHAVFFGNRKNSIKKGLYLKSVFSVDRNMLIPHSRYHSSWWSGNTMGKVRDMDLYYLEYATGSTGRADHLSFWPTPLFKSKFFLQCQKAVLKFKIQTCNFVSCIMRCFGMSR